MIGTLLRAVLPVEHGTSQAGSWFKKPKIVSEVAGNEIVVTLPGTSFRVIYTHMGKGQLVVKSFCSTKNATDNTKLAFPKFLALAWSAANDKARELGWIV
jgi:hypothetical protein